MSGWQRGAVFALGCLLVGTGGLAQEQAKGATRQAEGRLDVEYGVVIEQSPGDKRSEVAVPRELKSGERLHFRLRPKQAANAYVFVADKKGAFELVLPNEDKTPSSEIERNQWSALPEKDWLRFDEARGMDRIYLFVSAGPIKDIEELFAGGRTPGAVDETWLVDLRNKLDAEGSTTYLRGEDVIRLTHRRRGSVPVIVEEFTVRHK